MSELRTRLHYLPGSGWVGDVIPFAHDGRIWLYYLHELRDEPDSGTGWALVSTTDFVDYVEHGTVLPSGGREAEDFNCYTGSLVDDGEQLHLFYTGNNPAVRAADGETPLQQVMHATSDGDPTQWTKHPEHTFPAGPAYDPADWRDPFVFRAGEDQPWRMLLAARHLDGPERRRGLIAQLTSADLVTWSPAEPFWDPRRYITHECPDVFFADGWWYLVYSEFSDAFVTRYRMSRSPDGPWLAPDHDSVDGRAFYASKSVSFGGRRFFIGWIATREGEVDDGPWQWAGTMSVLEAFTAPDGTLGFGLPAELVASCREPVEIGLASSRLEAADSYTAVVSEHQLPSAGYVRVELDIEAGTRECGLLLRTSADGDVGYVLRLEPSRSRFVFDRWPRHGTGPGQWEISGDQPYVIELERPCDLPPGRHTVELLIEPTTCVAVVDQKVALSTRIYDHPSGRLGVFASDGAVSVVNVGVRSR